MTAPALQVEQGVVPLGEGAQLAYQVHRPAGAAGQETPLILLRPLGGSMVLWGAFRERLAAQRPVISFDPRGAGRSSPAPLISTTRRMAADVVAVLDHLHLAKAHVFGLSLGGMVASWVAISAPDRVLSLTLGSTVRRGLDISRHGLGRALGMAECMLQPTATAVEISLLHRVLSRVFRREHPDEVRRMEELLRGEPASRGGLLKLAAAAALHDASADLGRILVPTLLLWGERDSLLGRHSQDELHAAFISAEFTRIQRSGHDLSLEQPAATADRINTAFCAGSPTRTELVGGRADLVLADAISVGPHLSARGTPESTSRSVRQGTTAPYECPASSAAHPSESDRE